MDLVGKTALITGGAHRVGQAMTLALAQAGANVAVNYRSSKEKAQTTVAQAKTYGVQATAVQADVSQSDQVQSLVASVNETLGPVDILINSASNFAKTPFPCHDLNAWRRVTDILVYGALSCANEVAGAMLSRGEGAIINIVDLSAFQPWRGFGAHSVGKAALLALTRQLALELAPAVRVNAIAPGLILPPPHYTPQQTARSATNNLMGRWGKTDDVTDALLYLLRSDFVTGEVLVVDGGERLGQFKAPAETG